MDLRNKTPSEFSTAPWVSLIPRFHCIFIAYSKIPDFHYTFMHRASTVPASPSSQAQTFLTLDIRAKTTTLTIIRYPSLIQYLNLNSIIYLVLLNLYCPYRRDNSPLPWKIIKTTTIAESSGDNI